MSRHIIFPLWVFFFILSRCYSSLLLLVHSFCRIRWVCVLVYSSLLSAHSVCSSCIYIHLETVYAFGSLFARLHDMSVVHLATLFDYIKFVAHIFRLYLSSCSNSTPFTGQIVFFLLVLFFGANVYLCRWRWITITIIITATTATTTPTARRHNIISDKSQRVCRIVGVLCVSLCG